MWMLEEEVPKVATAAAAAPADREPLRLWLCAEMGGAVRSCPVGRRPPATLLFETGKSISRAHANITCGPDPSGAGRPVVEITDKSSFGTYVNQNRCDKAVPLRLTEGDRIKFGNEATLFRLKWQAIVVASSSLSAPTRKSLARLRAAIGFKQVSQWSDEVTHLIQDKIVLTEKVPQPSHHAPARIWICPVTRWRVSHAGNARAHRWCADSDPRMGCGAGAADGSGRTDAQGRGIPSRDFAGHHAINRPG
eukprot:COSAG01_NODE_37_length_34085_cov_64.376626_5_plen_250_part_00